MDYFKRRYFRIFLSIAVLAAVSYSLIRFEGGDLNGYLLVLYVGNFLLSFSIAFGLAPIAGIILMILSGFFHKRLLVYTIGFCLQALPLVYDIYFYDHDVVRYRTFTIPFFIYLGFVLLGYYYLLFRFSSPEVAKLVTGERK